MIRKINEDTNFVDSTDTFNNSMYKLDRKLIYIEDMIDYYRERYNEIEKQYDTEYNDEKFRTDIKQLSQEINEVYDLLSSLE